MEQAEAFAAMVKDRYRLDTRTFTTDDDAYQDDPRPFVADPPVVHVAGPGDQAIPGFKEMDVKERLRAIEASPAFRLESRIAREVEAYGGEFAGT